MAGRARTLGVEAQFLDAGQTAELDPGVRIDVAGSVYFPKDCHLSPNRFMSGLRQQLEKLGVAFLWNTEVSGFTHHASRITAVRTTAGELAADEFAPCCRASFSPVRGQPRLPATVRIRVRCNQDQFL